MQNLSLLSLVLSFSMLSMQAEEQSSYPKEVQQFLSTHCYSCHGNQKDKGDINFEAQIGRGELIKNYRLWEAAIEQVEMKEMPPKKKAQPKEEEKQVFVKWAEQILHEAATKNANDPGRVVMRRLNPQEMEHSLRDLTGLNLEVASKLPVDGGGGEGFSNTGAALFTSPNHLEAYLELFENVASKAAILPQTGVRFYEQDIGERNFEAILSEIERSLREQYETIVEPLMPDKFEDLKIKDYLLAAWMFQNKETFKVNSLEQCAQQFKVDANYLNNWWVYLNGTKPESRFLDFERVPFRNLPKATDANIAIIPAAVDHAINSIAENRKLWYRMQRPQQDSNAYQTYGKKLNLTKEMTHFTLMVTDAGDGAVGDVVIWKNLKIKYKIKEKPWWREVGLKTYLQEQLSEWQKSPKQDELDKKIARLQGQLEKFGKAPEGLTIGDEDLILNGGECMVIPVKDLEGNFNAATVMWTNQPDIKKASAQVAVLNYAHWEKVPELVPGFIVVYDSDGDSRHQIWKEVAPMREIFGDEKFRRMFKIQDNYKDKQSLPIIYYMSRDQVMGLLEAEPKQKFERMHQDYDMYYGADLAHLRWREKSLPKHKDGRLNEEAFSEKQKKDYENTKNWIASNRKKIEAAVIQQLFSFAEKAWRRPLEKIEQDQLTETYEQGLAQNLNSESAGRLVLQRIFLSPNFIFKVEQQRSEKEHQVNAFELAARLSYTLWASTPDEELLKAAKEGSLSKKEDLDRQINRMLKDARSQGLARQFGGEWLEFKDFSMHKGVDQATYSKVTPELLALMEQESTFYFSELIQQDRSILEIFFGEETYLNEQLANYYQIEGIKGEAFRKVNVKQYQRGGLLGMGAMLIKTSYPLRTSPVLRGSYILGNIMGVHLPTPPDNVPPLEQVAKATDQPMSVRQMLELHRKNENCASCHDKIDPLGFALENFGADGLFRDKDHGVPVDAQAQLKGGVSFSGVQGLKEHLKSKQEGLLDHACRKFIGYSLGREVGIGDRAILAEMIKSLKQNNFQFSAMVRPLLHSKVFNSRRGKEGSS